MTDLLESDHFSEILPVEIQSITETTIVLLERAFESSDSFTYFAENSEGEKYIAKIFRFEYWPPAGKIESILELLDSHSIPHEDVLHLSHEHSFFRHGWQLSRFIEGGTAKENLENTVISPKDYYIGIGRLLQSVHSISLSTFDSIHEPTYQFASFQEAAHKEMRRHGGKLLQLEDIRELISSALEKFENLLTSIVFPQAVLVHDDVNPGNVMWNNGNPILIDWVDAVGGPYLRDFATPTFRSDEQEALWLEQGYGEPFNRTELYLHQLMRLIRLASFYYFEDERLDDYRIAIERLRALLQREVPFGY